MTGVPVPRIAPVQPPERVMWRLRKDSRIAEARVRELSFGCELRFIADGILRSTEVFRGERGELSDRATAKRRDFERLGWQVVS